MNPVRDNKEGKRRCEAEGMGGEMGQERAAGVPILGSLRPTKHEITYFHKLHSSGGHTISKSSPRPLFNEVKRTVIIGQMAILFTSCTNGNGDFSFHK